MWLQGGPGASSLFGLFVINGPLQVYENLTLDERDVTWNKNYSMLYVDNPVGAGKHTVKHELSDLMPVFLLKTV